MSFLVIPAIRIGKGWGHPNAVNDDKMKEIVEVDPMNTRGNFHIKQYDLI